MLLICQLCVSTHQAAKTTSAWLITSGFNMGVMKSVGQAVRQGQSFCWDNDRMVHVLRCIGIAPWGYVKDRKALEGTETEVLWYNLILWAWNYVVWQLWTCLWTIEFQITSNITKASYFFIVILILWIALPTKYTKFNVQWIKMISQYVVWLIV